MNIQKWSLKGNVLRIEINQITKEHMVTTFKKLKKGIVELVFLLDDENREN